MKLIPQKTTWNVLQYSENRTIPWTGDYLELLYMYVKISWNLRYFPFLGGNNALKRMKTDLHCRQRNCYQYPPTASTSQRCIDYVDRRSSSRQSRAYLCVS